MKTFAMIMTSIVYLSISGGSVIAKPHLPHHKTSHVSHSKMENKHHVLTKGERQMRKLQCGNGSKSFDNNF